MNLFLFPAPADNKGGYNIAVLDSYIRLKPQASDDILWCCLSKPECAMYNHYIYFYQPFLSFRTIYKVLQKKLNTELSTKDLSFAQGKDYNEIHCDDVIFYRAIRKLFPHKIITVRFHNCFSRIADRSKLLDIKSDWRFDGKMKLSKCLEKEIFADPLVHKVFITNEDAQYYELMTGKNDFSIWTLVPDLTKMIVNRNSKRCLVNKLVWFGGVEGHKISSLRWFIEKIFPLLKKTIPEIEFHLYGRNTRIFSDKSNNIFAHGEYQGKSMPLKDEALYINPDILGGGIKVKIQSFLNNGVTFISSPFGFEGYDKALIDNDYCYVIEEDCWIDAIVNILTNK